MNKRMVYVLFVEGPDDTRFARRIFVPKAQGLYLDVRIKEYSQERLAKTNAYIRSIKCADKWDYVFLADIDDFPCVTTRKGYLIGQYSNLESDRILVVRYEIESWYLAGVDAITGEEFRIQIPRDTSGTTKEDFNSQIPRRFESRTDFMTEILNRYNINEARSKNESLDYGMSKHFDVMLPPSI